MLSTPIECIYLDTTIVGLYLFGYMHPDSWIHAPRPFALKGKGYAVSVSPAPVAPPITPRPHPLTPFPSGDCSAGGGVYMLLRPF